MSVAKEYVLVASFIDPQQIDPNEMTLRDTQQLETKTVRFKAQVQIIQALFAYLSQEHDSWCDKSDLMRSKSSFWKTLPDQDPDHVRKELDHMLKCPYWLDVNDPPQQNYVKYRRSDSCMGIELCAVTVTVTVDSSRDNHPFLVAEPEFYQGWMAQREAAKQAKRAQRRELRKVDKKEDQPRKLYKGLKPCPLCEVFVCV